MGVLNVVGMFVMALGFICGFMLILTPIHATPLHQLSVSGKDVILMVLYPCLLVSGIGLASLGATGKSAIDRLLAVSGVGNLCLGAAALLMSLVYILDLIAADTVLVWWLCAPFALLIGTMSVLMGGKHPENSKSI